MLCFSVYVFVGDMCFCVFLCFSPIRALIRTVLGFYKASLLGSEIP